MVQWFRRVAVSLETWVLIQFYSLRLLKLCAAAWPFCVHWAIWLTDTRAFILQRSLLISNPSVAVWHQTQDQGPDSATCAGHMLAWRMGSDYSYCTDSELFDRQMHCLNRWKYISNAQESRPTLLFNCIPVPVVMLVFLLSVTNISHLLTSC